MEQDAQGLENEFDYLWRLLHRLNIANVMAIDRLDGVDCLCQQRHNLL